LLLILMVLQVRKVLKAIRAILENRVQPVQPVQLANQELPGRKALKVLPVPLVPQELRVQLLRLRAR
jgi:hypothetical protein